MSSYNKIISISTLQDIPKSRINLSGIVIKYWRSGQTSNAHLIKASLIQLRIVS
jgi:hypothetical protein